jgi:hypothetical protein
MASFYLRRQNLPLKNDCKRMLIKKKGSRIRNQTFYLQFCMETPEGHQKSLFNTSKVKKIKIYIWDLSDKV